jgi:hypothetical protein
MHGNQIRASVAKIKLLFMAYAVKKEPAQETLPVTID